MTYNTAFCHLDGSTILFLNSGSKMQAICPGQTRSKLAKINFDRKFRIRYQTNSKTLRKICASRAKFHSGPQTIICSLKCAERVTAMNFKNDKGCLE